MDDFGQGLGETASIDRAHPSRLNRYGPKVGFVLIGVLAVLMVALVFALSTSEGGVLRDLEYEGQQMLTEGRWSEATEVFSTLIDSYPPDDHDALAAAYFNRSVAHFQQGRIEDALADETAAIEHDPSDINLLATLHLNRSREYSYLDLPEDAIAAATAAIELESADTRTLARAHMNRANQLANLDRFDEALADFDAAIEVSAIPSDRTHARVGRAEALLYVDRPYEAIEDASTAIDALLVEDSEQRDGTSATTSELLGRAYLARGGAKFYLATELDELLDEQSETADQIEADLTHAIDLIGDDDPSRLATAFFIRGAVRYFGFDDVGARSDLERGLELVPSSDPRYQYATDLLAEIAI